MTTPLSQAEALLATMQRFLTGKPQIVTFCIHVVGPGRPDSGEHLPVKKKRGSVKATLDSLANSGSYTLYKIDGSLAETVELLGHGALR